jgi:hypothetical protein
MCGEDVSKEFFGQPGNRVSVTYEVQQFWSEFAEPMSPARSVQIGKDHRFSGGGKIAPVKSSHGMFPGVLRYVPRLPRGVYS